MSIGPLLEITVSRVAHHTGGNDNPEIAQHVDQYINHERSVGQYIPVPAVAHRGVETLKSPSHGQHDHKRKEEKYPEIDIRGYLFHTAAELESKYFVKHGSSGVKPFRSRSLSPL